LARTLRLITHLDEQGPRAGKFANVFITITQLKTRTQTSVQSIALDEFGASFGIFMFGHQGHSVVVELFGNGLILRGNFGRCLGRCRQNSTNACRVDGGYDDENETAEARAWQSNGGFQAFHLRPPKDVFVFFEVVVVTGEGLVVEGFTDDVGGVNPVGSVDSATGTS
jgi:hypothetical protein